MRVREMRVTYAPTDSEWDNRKRVSSPSLAAQILFPVLGPELVETFVILLLDTKHRVLGLHTVSRGTVDSTMAHPRDVFRAACLANATAIITAHNHPSGEAEPSPDDRAMFQRLDTASEILGIDILDHMVITPSGRYFSAKEAGLR